MGALGRNWKARMAARFGGRLYDVTFTRNEYVGVDPSDPSGPPLATATTYAAKGMAFDYRLDVVDNQKITKGDYQVTILLGTVVDAGGAPSDVVPAPGDNVQAPPPGQTTPRDATVIGTDAVTEAQITLHVRGVPA